MEEQLSRRDFLKRTGGVVASAGLVGKVLSEIAKADLINVNGWLDIENIIGSSHPILSIVHYNDSGVSDGYDTFDDTWLNPPSGNSSLYSDIGTHKLSQDFRLPSSKTAFDIKLVYKGTLGSSAPNHLKFVIDDFDWKFGNKPIIFQSNRLLYGDKVDVRAAIAKNGGIVQLKDLPVGTYDPNTPYGSGILTIGTRLLGDLNDDGTINFKDQAIQADDWKKTPGGIYVGDVNGPNGVPDGVVDFNDLSKIVKPNWLADVNDPNTW